MPTPAHVVQILLVHVDSDTGQIFTKAGVPLSNFEGRQTRTITRPREFSTEHRIQPDTDVPNSTGFPTISAYLIAEGLDDFLLGHIDQYLIITYGPTV